MTGSALFFGSYDATLHPRVAVLRDDLGWLGHATSAARDVDVYLLAFDDYAARLPAGVRPHLEPFRTFITARQTRAYGELAACLESARFRRLTRRWRLLVSKWQPVHVIGYGQNIDVFLAAAPPMTARTDR